ncbi:MAG TPA: hypothetical protein VIO33_02090 [Burkholderiaceae bacterium]
MAALTTLGIVHTAISIVALVSGVVVLMRDRRITSGSGLGKLYLISTVLTALTGLGIFQHGGFGPPHVLAILTLLAISFGIFAERSPFFGGWAKYLVAVAYSATVLFHFIPGVTETSTRLPVGSPLLASAEDPILQKVYGVLFVVFAIGLVLQLRWLRAGPAR